MILDVEPTGLPVRLFGAGLAEFAGMDGTGLDFTWAAPEDQRAQLLARDTLCATHPCGLRLGMLATTNNGRTFVNNVMVLPVTRSASAYSLVRVSDVGPVVALEDAVKPMSVKNYTLAEWVDIGAGTPTALPWFEGSSKT